MNILIPDIWLRKFLKTKATPEKIKELLSLSGPSIERIYGEGNDTVYDIEVTGNRPDAMSVVGIAREAATILPESGIDATLIGDPYRDTTPMPKGDDSLKLQLITDPNLNPRWMSVIFDNVQIKASPLWLSEYLELAGMRSINNVVDITNYLMRAYGQPAHVFDYDAISGHRMTLRASRKGEKLTTLDGKVHTLPGDDIVIADSTGKLIDLCGIMGGENSAVTEKTRRVMLFLQTYDPVHIRKTSMSLAHRTEAAGLFEKGLDTEVVKPVFIQGILMMQEITGGVIASRITDIYPKPYKPLNVSVSAEKIRSYIGDIRKDRILGILGNLGFKPKYTGNTVRVTVPPHRRDVGIDVDIIEEIARIYGYHTIPSVLPEHAPPVSLPDPHLGSEESVKIRLRDWGYTEIITYSMVSDEQMRLHSGGKPAYAIANPLSTDWMHMRPNVFMSMIPAVSENLKIRKDIRVFELGMAYMYRDGDLPLETPMLEVVFGGHRFLEAKGLAESIFSLFGLSLPEYSDGSDPSIRDWYGPNYLSLGEFGSVGELRPSMLSEWGIPSPLTRLSLDFRKLVLRTNPTRVFTQIPKYPPVVEDLSFIVPDAFRIGPFITFLKTVHPLVTNVSLLDIHEHTRTFHVIYQDPSRNLTSDTVIPVRNKLIDAARRKFEAVLKTQ